MQIRLAVYQLALLRRNVWLRPLLLTTVKGKLVLFLLVLASINSVGNMSDLWRRQFSFCYSDHPLDLCFLIIISVSESLKISATVGIVAGWSRRFPQRAFCLRWKY